MDGEKQDTTTGRQPGATPIPESVGENTAAVSTLAQPKIESASIRAALILALWQTDFYDLQSKGLKVAILAKDGMIYASLKFPGHELGFVEGEILLDGAKVSEA